MSWGFRLLDIDVLIVFLDFVWEILLPTVMWGLRYRTIDFNQSINQSINQIDTEVEWIKVTGTCVKQPRTSSAFLYWSSKHLLAEK